jgi:hypothetical protein
MREIMSATVKKTNKKNGKVALGARPEKGHLAPEVKIANEIICDHVWDKLYPPISVTCSKWYVRKAPFVLRARLWI